MKRQVKIGPLYRNSVAIKRLALDGFRFCMIGGVITGTIAILASVGEQLTRKNR